MQPQNRLHGADFVRAVACLTVLCHHLAQRMSWNAALPGLEWFRSFAQMGTFGVAMFFVLSGFLLARPFWQALDRDEPFPSLQTYVLRRAARILPGFWLALIVSFVLSFLVFGVKLDGQLVVRFLSGFLLVADWHWVTWFPVEVNSPLWSISVEVMSYVLLPLAMATLLIGRRGVHAWRARILWVAVVVVAILAHWLFSRFYDVDASQRGWRFGLVGGAKEWLPRYNPFGFFAMFCIGSLAAGLQTLVSRWRHWVFDVLMLTGIGLAVFVLARHLAPGTDPSGYGFLGVPYAFPWFQLAVALVLASGPSSRLVGRLLDNAVTRYVALISFGIYIWHYVVLELVRRAWFPDFDHGQVADPMRFVVVSLIVAGVAFMVAHCSFYLVERPFAHLARRRAATSGLGPASS